MRGEIRMALAAGRSRVFWMWCARTSSWWARAHDWTAGGAGGSGFVSKMPFGLKLADPLSMAVAAALLLAFALIAGCLPVRKASLVDPMEALR